MASDSGLRSYISLFLHISVVNEQETACAYHARERHAQHVQHGDEHDANEENRIRVGDLYVCGG